MGKKMVVRVPVLEPLLDEFTENLTICDMSSALWKMSKWQWNGNKTDEIHGMLR